MPTGSQDLVRCAVHLIVYSFSIFIRINYCVPAADDHECPMTTRSQARARDAAMNGQRPLASSDPVSPLIFCAARNDWSITRALLTDLH
jgi:hypothetical protein